MRNPCKDCIYYHMRGRWIEENGCQICSECGEEHEWDEYRAAYCDVCGAEMEVDNG